MIWKKVYWEDVLEGQDIGSYSQEMTPLKVIAGAMVATRDFYPVHHDRDFAQKAKLKDIIINIMHTEGLLCKLATDWSGPTGELKKCSFRIKGSTYPGDTYAVKGKVVRKYMDGGLHLVELEINSSNQREPAASAVMTLALPTRA